DGAAGEQQGFEQGGLAGGGVACERHVADVLRAVGHERTSPCVEGGRPSWLSALRDRAWCARRAVMAGGRHGAGPQASRRRLGESSGTRDRSTCRANTRARSLRVPPPDQESPHG